MDVGMKRGEPILPTLVGFPHKDVLGKFRLRWNDCEHCGSTGQVCVEYWKPDFIYFGGAKGKAGRAFKDGKLLLKKSRTNLGVTCGCYAKLHRQLTHINSKKG
jgi:hypothetical protein